jgi:hypothetical protein
MEMAVLDMRDEATERQFLQTLRSMGVPIADEHMMVGVSFDFKESLDRMEKEMVMKSVAEQRAKMDTFKILTAKGLPVPPELQALIDSMNGGAPGAGAEMGAMPPPPPIPGGGPMAMPSLPDEGMMGPGGMGDAVPMGGPPPAGPMSPDLGPVPDISNERRPGLQYNRESSISEKFEYEGDPDLNPESASAIKKAAIAKRPRSIKLTQEDDE